MTVADKNQQVAGQNLIPTKCPNCGGFISFKKGGKVDCEYCGSSFMLNQAHLATNSKVRNLYELAYAAQEGNNVGDAHRYFTKILEEDTGEALAWYGKGTSALGMSTGANINSDEALVSFDKAAQYSDEKEKANLNSEIGKTCNHYASLIYRWLSANGWLDQFNSDEVMRLWEEGDKYKEMDFKERKLFVDPIVAKTV